MGGTVSNEELLRDALEALLNVPTYDGSVISTARIQIARESARSALALTKTDSGTDIDWGEILGPCGK